MVENFDYSLIDWSRAQFALTAFYHWLFVPLTLGLGFIMAIMETVYYKTGNPQWKKTTKFWMTLFGINFAIGVATGLILEFEFGTNWSNYSWFVGDIFGAPLAIEGILAFFLEATFVAVMFFGWDKVSKKFHLLSTWLVAFGANLSALWILVANAWMQLPVGMTFNPESARNEMTNFWDVFLSPMAINKFLHTITSSFVLASIFVVGISAWFLLKKRQVLFAKRSIIVAGVFGLVTSIFTVLTGDISGQLVAKHQPMKFAAIEGLYKGQKNAGLIAIGLFSTEDPGEARRNVKDFSYKIEIPNMLSYLAYRDFEAFVPGIEDLIKGYTYTNDEGKEVKVISANEKIRRGKKAIRALSDYKKAKDAGDEAAMASTKKIMDDNFQYFGYGYFNDPNRLIPNVPMTFYSFHFMVLFGFYFVLFFIVILILAYKRRLENNKFWLRVAIFTIPIAYLASMFGWVTAEMGRQPWVIQDLMPTMAAVSRLSAESVELTFWLFAVLFTALLIAEIRIMSKQINIGPKEGGH